LRGLLSRASACARVGFGDYVHEGARFVILFRRGLQGVCARCILRTLGEGLLGVCARCILRTIPSHPLSPPLHPAPQFSSALEEAKRLEAVTSSAFDAYEDDGDLGLTPAELAQLQSLEIELRAKAALHSPSPQRESGDTARSGGERGGVGPRALEGSLASAVERGEHEGDAKE
jgi:hypothetical protein